MRRALNLARMALGSTSPNPAVGAVVVRDGRVVGEGFTQPPGHAHAEVVALAMAGARARGAAMYVTLEPCAHFGRTPPCADAIVEAGIEEVHIAILDPNPLVNGRGRSRLEEAGVRTHLGEGADEAAEINEAFLKHVVTRRPFVTAKWAMSLDGKIATRSGDSKWITGATARAYAHYLRAINDAVVVGVATVLADDPRLTVRIPEDVSADSTPAGLWPRQPRQPLRVVLDSHGRIMATARVLDVSDGPAMVATTERMSPSTRRDIEARGAEVLVVPERDGLVDLRAVMDALGERGVTGVLIEGGGQVLGSAMFDGLVDKVCAFVAPKVIGGDAAPSPVRGAGAPTMAQVINLHRQRLFTVGEDVLVVGYTRGGSLWAGVPSAGSEQTFESLSRAGRRAEG